MKVHDYQEGEPMERPDDVMFSGAKFGKDVPAAERRERERAKRARQKARQGLQDKPGRPGGPPEQTDNQRRTGGPGPVRTERPGSQRVRPRRPRPAPAPAPAPTPTPETVSARPRRRPLPSKPQRPS